MNQPTKTLPIIPGLPFDFGGGRIYVVPPLSLGALEQMQERLAALPTLSGIDPVSVGTIIDAAHLALRRNYPELTRGDVAELIDLSTMGEVYEALMDVSGIKRRAAQAAREAAAGNAQAESQFPGVSSSPTSAPTPAGLGTTSEPA